MIFITKAFVGTFISESFASDSDGEAGSNKLPVVARTRKEDETICTSTGSAHAFTGGFSNFIPLSSFGAGTMFICHKKT